jgi:CDI toxin restriction endonuclease-like domain
MSGVLLDGFALVTGPLGRAYLAAEAIQDWRAGNKTSAVMGALAIIPGERLAGSVWKLGNFARGVAIETALGKNLAAGFPVIDKFLNGTATSIKSIDLTAKTYQDTEKLASTLDNYVDKVANFNGAKYGTQAVEGSEITARELQVAIPKGGMSAAQQKVFDAAAARAAKLPNPVKMTVTEVK